ncbi:MAG: V-type ATP synthase subunit A [Synergistetes bacterium]|nr:V-type ATP synthase subunit A [Synergistota bacterium]
MGHIRWISGPVVKVKTVEDVKMLEMVRVGDMGLIGEVISVSEKEAVIQVYEETEGLRLGEGVFGTGEPLSMTLGPGLLGGIFDGIGRPLTAIKKELGDFILRGANPPSLSFEDMWRVRIEVKKGDFLKPGDIVARIRETPLIEHRIMCPLGVSGVVIETKESGDYTINAVIARVKDEKGRIHEIKLFHRWPVRKPRPILRRISLDEPLLTGQRVLDFLFPLAKGGTAAIPGGFGTGKTVTQHQLAKWADADVIVYIGCGERGNEMTEVLEDFPKLVDPQSGHSLMERIVLIANVSNMPVSAREASIFTGITIAEYFRDMGYDVAVMADSTSRWAEALREIAGRLEEMPAEEGFPAYLPTRLAEFYERAGRVITLGGRKGSVSIIGAVSPPGGDFSEPVTQHTRRFIRCFWALDKELASARHFPSVNWLNSYSEYFEDLKGWFRQKVAEDFPILRERVMNILQEESNLQRIAQLVGVGVLPEPQKLILLSAKMLREGFLRQNAFDPVDTYCSPRKSYLLLKLMLKYYDRASELVKKGVLVQRIEELPITSRILRFSFTVSEDKMEEEYLSLRDELEREFSELEREYEKILSYRRRA